MRNEQRSLSETYLDRAYTEELRSWNDKCWKPFKPSRKSMHLTVTEGIPRRNMRSSETGTEFIRIPNNLFLREDSALFFRRNRTAGFRWQARQMGSVDRVVNPGTKFLEHDDNLLRKAQTLHHSQSSEPFK